MIRAVTNAMTERSKRQSVSGINFRTALEKYQRILNEYVRGCMTFTFECTGIEAAGVMRKIRRGH